MPRKPDEPALQDETRIYGPNSNYIAVRGDDKYPRAWLAGQPVCPALGHHHIAHVGVLEVTPPFHVVREDQSGTFLLSCTKGEGRVLSEGVWKTVKEGQSCLLPPFVRNSYGCIPDKSWAYAWVRYHETREQHPIISTNSPVIGHFDPYPLMHAIRGLHAETLGNHNPSAIKLWADLIHGYVARFSQPHHGDSRLWKLWQAVENDIGHAWSLDEMSDEVAVSKEHLRRLSLKEMGRSPMQHVTFLRMQRAAYLLATTDEKMATVCREVGYENSFTFSNTFKKWMGVRPSEFRRA
jgi:AraC-like DNA-binding protein